MLEFIGVWVIFSLVGFLLANRFFDECDKLFDLLMSMFVSLLAGPFLFFFVIKEVWVKYDISDKIMEFLNRKLF